MDQDQNPPPNPFAPAAAAADPLPPSTFLHSQRVRKQPLNRSEMEAVIKQGGSVIYNGRVINDARHLPHEAELARGDPLREEAARRDIHTEIRRLNDQLARLTGPLAGSPAPAAAVKPGDPPPAPRQGADEELKEAQRRALLAGAPAPHEIAPVSPPPAAAPAQAAAPDATPAQDQQAGNRDGGSNRPKK